MSPTSLYCGGIQANITIVGKRFCGETKFAQGSVVIAFHIIMIEPEREIAFAEIRLQPERLQCLRISLLFPSLCWLIEMVDGTGRDREPRVGQRELWVERDGLFVKRRRRLEIL